MEMEDLVPEKKAKRRRQGARYQQHARPLFVPHRDKPYVAARPFRWKGVQLKCGDELPDEWPIFHLRHLHTQSLIGPKGHPWVEQRIASWALRLKRGEERTKAKAARKQELLDRRIVKADLAVEEAVEIAEEARTVRDRIAGFFGGGESDDAGSTSPDDPA